MAPKCGAKAGADPEKELRKELSMKKVQQAAATGQNKPKNEQKGKPSKPVQGTEKGAKFGKPASGLKPLIPKEAQQDNAAVDNLKDYCREMMKENKNKNKVMPPPCTPPARASRATPSPSSSAQSFEEKADARAKHLADKHQRIARALEERAGLQMALRQTKITKDDSLEAPTMLAEFLDEQAQATRDNAIAEIEAMEAGEGAGDAEDGLSECSEPDLDKETKTMEPHKEEAEVAAEEEEEEEEAEEPAEEEEEEAEAAQDDEEVDEQAASPDEVVDGSESEQEEGDLEVAGAEEEDEEESERAQKNADVAAEEKRKPEAEDGTKEKKAAKEKRKPEAEDAKKAAKEKRKPEADAKKTREPQPEDAKKKRKPEVEDALMMAKKKRKPEGEDAKKATKEKRKPEVEDAKKMAKEKGKPEAEDAKKTCEPETEDAKKAAKEKRKPEAKEKRKVQWAATVEEPKKRKIDVESEMESALKTTEENAQKMRNSSTHKREWDSFVRQAASKHSFPCKLAPSYLKSKVELFNFWLDAGKDWDKTLAIVERKQQSESLSRKQWTAIQAKDIYATRTKEKADELVEKRKAANLYYLDDDFPEDPMDRAWKQGVHMFHD